MDITRIRLLKQKPIWLLMVLFCYTPLANINQNFIRDISERLYWINRIAIYGVCGYLVLVSLKFMLSRVKFDTVVLVLFFIIQLTISFLLHSNYSDFYLKIAMELAFSVPWYIVTRSIRDYQKLILILERCSYFILLCGFVLILVDASSQWGSSYNQSYGYMISIVPIVLFNKMFRSFKFYDLILFLVSTALTLSMGARGPLLCILLFLVFRFIQLWKENKTKMLTLFISGFVSVFMLYVLFNVAMEWLFRVFQKLGLSTRILSRLLNHSTDSVFQSDGRRAIQINVTDSIMSNPLLGVGLGTDRIVLSNKGPAQFNEGFLIYPHNILLEFLMQYGVIFGSALFILVIVVFLRASLFKNDINYRNIVTIFFAVGFCPLLVSKSYLAMPLFYAFLGFCMSNYKSAHKIRSY